MLTEQAASAPPAKHRRVTVMRMTTRLKLHMLSFSIAMRMLGTVVMSHH